MTVNGGRIGLLDTGQDLLVEPTGGKPVVLQLPVDAWFRDQRLWGAEESRGLLTMAHQSPVHATIYDEVVLDGTMFALLAWETKLAGTVLVASAIVRLDMQPVPHLSAVLPVDGQGVPPFCPDIYAMHGRLLLHEPWHLSEVNPWTRRVTKLMSLPHDTFPRALAVQRWLVADRQREGLYVIDVATRRIQTLSMRGSVQALDGGRYVLLTEGVLLDVLTLKTRKYTTTVWNAPHAHFTLWKTYQVFWNDKMVEVFSTTGIRLFRSELGS